jgi:hypothetical integral membrane protein (TIGR02206 family)
MPGAAWDWSETFRAHSAQHLAVVVVCFGIIAVWCVVGRLMLRDQTYGLVREARMRRWIGWVIIVTQVWIQGRRMMPDRWTVDDSLPLHLCRVIVWVSVWAIMTLNWRARALSLFMGFGLCAQIFVTPFLAEGHGHLVFWTYWWNHLIIVGIAVYDVVVLGYRPADRDLSFAIWIGMLYVAAAAVINKVLGTNYSYYGEGEHDGASAVDFMGPYPWRIFILAGACGVVFLLIYGFSRGAMWIRTGVLGKAPPRRIDPR